MGMIYISYFGDALTMRREEWGEHERYITFEISRDVALNMIELLKDYKRKLPHFALRSMIR